MEPSIMGDNITFTAGQSFSVDCNFTVPQHLVRAPTVEWLNSSLSQVSGNSTLLFPRLLTSHGRDYTCVVTVSIPQLNISQTGHETTTIIVQSNDPLF